MKGYRSFIIHLCFFVFLVAGFTFTKFRSGGRHKSKLDPNCQNLVDEKCSLCKQNYFLINGTCSVVCPENTISNIIKRQCEALTQKSKTKYLSL